MSYIKLNNGTPESYSFAQLRRDNPNVSFPRNPSDEFLESYGIFRVTTPEQPTFDPTKQVLTKNGPDLVDGNWTYSWDVLPKPSNLVRLEADAQVDNFLSNENFQAFLESVLEAVGASAGAKAQVASTMKAKIRSNRGV